MSRAEELRRERVDTWLAQGGVVLASTDRAARALVSGFDAARRAEGKTAWPTPAIFGWDGWVRDRWVEQNPWGNGGGLVLLNPLQERAHWSAVIRDSAAGRGMLHVGRLAEAAMRAGRLLAEFAPGGLARSARLGWSEDAAVFSGWLEEFDARCRRDGLITAGKLVLELASSLGGDDGERPALLLIGFDRVLGTQRALLDAWGVWELEVAGERAAKAGYCVAPDLGSEIRACVEWLRKSAVANPAARLMVVTTGLQERRGELERALLQEDGLAFEFSLGVPLGRVGVVRAALLLLRWLREPLAEAELDWLIGSGFCVESREEGNALAAVMRAVRRRGRERPEWGLGDFVAEIRGLEVVGHTSRAKAPDAEPHSQLEGWVGRLLAAQELLAAAPSRQGPMEWLGLVEELTFAAGWPGYRPLGSVGFQARQRWDRVMEDCGSLGFGGVLMDWADFLATLGDAVAGTIFAAESANASILIAEPIPTAGQLADGIWFLGASEDNWPGRGQPNPLLPVGLQRDAGMPHASSQADWELAEVATERLLASADEVVFSFAAQSGTAEARPSRLVVRHLGMPVVLPELEKSAELVLAEMYEDRSLIPFAGAALRGGAAALTRQSVCPFQAFGKTRLAAEDWEPAESGLNARQRGQLLHAVLRKVWAGRGAGGIATLDDLLGVADLRIFVGGFVRAAMVEEFDPETRNAIPARFGERFLALEAERLTRLVTEWLGYERGRVPFRVEGTEVSREVTVAGLTLRLRLDRVDVLQDGSRLVVDYKTGVVGPKAWSGVRPDDVQLPLYATFGVEHSEDERLEGLVFGRVRPGDVKFVGRVRDAGTSLRTGMDRRSGLMRDPLTEKQLEDWRELIERLGRDFVGGRAEVNPKDLEKTCERCGLHAVCRIYENQTVEAMAAEVDAGGGDGEGFDE